MRRPTFLIVLSFLVATILPSCSGETVTSKYIDNQTDRDIGFVFYRYGYAQGDTLTVQAGSRKRISQSTRDKGEEIAPPCAEFIDSAAVSIEGGGTLSNNIAQEKYWTVETEQVRNMPPEYNHTCTYIIKQVNIIP